MENTFYLSLNKECLLFAMIDNLSIWSAQLTLFFQYFKTSLKTRLSIVYVETWESQESASRDFQNLSFGVERMTNIRIW